MAATVSGVLWSGLLSYLSLLNITIPMLRWKCRSPSCTVGDDFDATAWIQVLPEKKSISDKCPRILWLF